MGTLENRVALVTGASRGIGRAIAIALAGAGADVAVNYRKEQAAAEEVCAAIRQLGPRAHCRPGRRFALRRSRALVAASGARTRPRRILVNNAGITQVKPFLT